VSVGRVPEISVNPGLLRRNADTRTDLALKFAPLITTVTSQKWRPITADEYLKGSTLLAWDGTSLPSSKSEPKSTAELPTSCEPGTPEPCYILTHDCPPRAEWHRKMSDRRKEASDVGSALECDLAVGSRSTTGEFGIGSVPVYVRIVVRQKAHPGSESERVFRHLKQLKRLLGVSKRDLSVIVQYWYLFAFDDWRAETVMGELRQFHEGDWEAVTIGLSERAPLFVAYSAHCGGEWLRWDEAPVEDARPTHPVAFLGTGSHAEYPVRNAGASPDWASCLPIGGRRLSAITLGLNVVETVGEGVTMQTSREDDVLLVDSRTSPMTFPGKWGLQSGILFRPKIRFLRTYVLPGDDGGPLTPSLQRLWYDPIGAIFGEKSHYDQVSVAPDF
jgi:hypothetical protein